MNESIYKRKRVFSTGTRKRVLVRFSEDLENDGFSAKWSDKSGNVNAIVQHFHGNHFDIVAFGRGLKPENKKLIMQRFRSQNEDIKFIDGLAPISDLLLAQVKLAFLPEAGHIPCKVHVDNKSLEIEILEDCFLKVIAYQENRFFQSSKDVLCNAQLQRGSLSVNLEKSSRNRKFVVVSVNGIVIHLLEVV